MFYAQIAQLVEQRTENPRVAGSIPALGIFYLCELQCLLLYAQYDIKAIRESMYLWEKYLKNCRLIMLENTGHNYFYDADEQVNSVITAFITNSDILNNINCERSVKEG